ncbi:MAG: hypothetical protein ABR534_04485 [Desulfotignum sp.]|nr:hypothetical protein [Desulfobacteraceae bacterium]
MKKASTQSGGFLEDFLEWMGSPEGAESMDALDYVFNALDGAIVDPVKRRINWPNGESLSINQTVDRMGKDSGLDRQSILSHLIGWLQMEYMPEGLNEKQMELFENQIENWVEKYENDPPPTSGS